MCNLIQNLKNDIEEKYKKKNQVVLSEKEERIMNTFLDIELYTKSLDENRLNELLPFDNILSESSVASHISSSMSMESTANKVKLRSWDEEMEFANKVASKIQMKKAIDLAHDEIYSWLKEKLILNQGKVVVELKEERRRENLRKEFELSMNCGSFHTRY